MQQSHDQQQVVRQVQDDRLRVASHRGLLRHTAQHQGQEDHLRLVQGLHHGGVARWREQVRRGQVRSARGAKGRHIRHVSARAPLAPHALSVRSADGQQHKDQRSLRVLREDSARSVPGEGPVDARQLHAPRRARAQRRQPRRPLRGLHQPQPGRQVVQVRRRGGQPLLEEGRHRRQLRRQQLRGGQLPPLDQRLHARLCARLARPLGAQSRAEERHTRAAAGQARQREATRVAAQEGAQRGPSVHAGEHRAREGLLRPPGLSGPFRGLQNRGQQVSFLTESCFQNTKLKVNIKCYFRVI